MELIKNKSTITSLELVEQINIFRKEDGSKNDLAHSDLLKIIRDEFDAELNEGEISLVDYKDKKGELRPMFELSLNQSKQVLVRESKLVRKAVIAYIEKLEAMLKPRELTRLELIDQWRETEVARLEAENRAVLAEKKVAILTHVNKTYTSSEIAKELNLKSAIELNNLLHHKKIQFKQNGTWLLYTKYSSMALVDIKQEALDNGKVVFHRRWTQIGREFLIKLFDL